ncbi:MAG: MBOAT family protein [Gammaproteobacteria bacterium]|nr:MBOAT family protein [Gammaproteobacteria bacterium]
MLFNSYIFIFCYLPIVLVGYFGSARYWGQTAALLWLVAMSLIFYAWWNPIYSLLIIGSMSINYKLSQILHKSYIKKIYLIIGITLNLALIGYFKYTNFMIEQFNQVYGTDFFIKDIMLPLAISFFTFQQIAYLVDAYHGQTKEYNFLHYCLFVLFFPQLIAGPIVHHKELLPQFFNSAVYKWSSEHFSIGLTIFVIGLFKKVVLADGVSVYATPIFEAAESGVVLTLYEAWAGALAYTLQLYFDFSGYSDMAVGLARMFGVLLPINFLSPYKASSIIDFWHRWHITLSRYLRDYLYFPLGGNRRGVVRRYFNLFITMLLGGLWHGAGLTFLIWGMLHGFYLIINHLWRSLKQTFNVTLHLSWLSGALTFLCVVIGWVFFRAESWSVALSILKSMIGMNGIVLSNKIITASHIPLHVFNAMGVQAGDFFANEIISGKLAAKWILVLLVLVWCFPNVYEFMRNQKPALDFEGKGSRFVWQPSSKYAYFIMILFVWAIFGLSKETEFLYFNF